MSYQSIGLGSEADDGTGDALRVGGDKVNDNFVELYTLLGDATDLSSGISATSTVVTLTAPVISGTVSGDITVSGTFLPTGDTAASDNAAIGYTSAEGLILTGQGSTSDVTIKNDADADVIKIPTGTTNVTIVGDLTISGDDLTMGTNTSGAALIADGTNFNPVVISGDISINTSGVAAIGSGVIVVADMAANSIDSAQYVDGSIDLDHMAANSIDSAQYVDGSIDLDHMAANSIDSAQYVDGSIDTVHIADDAVTLAKMASGTDGNIISFDASGNPVAIATGSDGQVLTSTGAGSPPAFETAGGGITQNAIAGLILSKTGADTLTIAAGSARNAGDAATMVLAAFTKNVSASWAVGTGNGSLDTGSYAASTLYAAWLIRRSDTGVNDVLTSTSFTAPTMPASYDQKRLIGYFVTDTGPDIIAFTQVGDYFRMTGDVINDLSDSTITADAFETTALSVPPNCLAHIYVRLENVGDTATQGVMSIRTAGAADSAAGTESWGQIQTSATFDAVTNAGMVLVDGSSQVNYTASEGGGTAQVDIRTFGCLMLTRREP